MQQSKAAIVDHRKRLQAIGSARATHQIQQ